MTRLVDVELLDEARTVEFGPGVSGIFIEPVDGERLKITASNFESEEQLGNLIVLLALALESDGIV